MTKKMLKAKANVLELCVNVNKTLPQTLKTISQILI